MIPQACKRLAEVDFPIAEVSRHAAREKSIRHGHPSTLHLWWARRPLASSRAVLMALLLPDPCDPLCPPEFKEKARDALLTMRGRAMAWEALLKTDDGLRRVLLQFIANFANWDNAANQEYLDTDARSFAPRTRTRYPSSWTRSRVVAPSPSKRCGWDARRSPATSTPSPA